METGFPAIGGQHAGIGGENSFWPSFTDVMMVITLIFLMATSLLVVRNWQLVAELRESVAAEQIAAELIESTSQENATLEERLANAEQSNSILRLRLLKKEEELSLAQAAMREQETNIASLELRTSDLEEELAGSRQQLAASNLELEAANLQNRELSAQLAQQAVTTAGIKSDLDLARTQIAQLTESSRSQQLNITQLTEEKSQLNREIQTYNQQLQALKGEYETVKSKYEELIKPARSAKGKFIAEVYYVKDDSGDVIRYRQAGQPEFERVSLAEVESRLAKLKQEKGEDLYVKIIIPENSGLTYNEAWNFMRNLLVKYDYYYQE